MDSSPATINITVNAVNDVPVFTSTAVTTVCEGSTYSYSVTTADLDVADTLTIAATTQPTWLTLTDDGDGSATLSGVPSSSNVGDHAVTLQVTDGTNKSAEQSFTVSVAALPCTIGNAEEFSDASSHGANYLLGFKIDVTNAVTVDKLAVIAKQAGPNAKMALYTDVSGKPGELVVGSSSLTLVVGVNEFDVADTPIAAGSYWIMAVYDRQASVGIDYTQSSTIAYKVHTFTNPLPNTFGTPNVYSGQRFNYYVILK